MHDTFLTTQELAKTLNVAPYTIKKWRRTGKIPAVKMGDRTFWFDLPSVKAAILKLNGRAK